MLPSLAELESISKEIKKVPNQREEFKRQIHYGCYLLCSESGLRISEAVKFDLNAKTQKGLYRISKPKGKKERLVYIPKEVIRELKKQNWKPNQTNRLNFYHFLQKTKKELNISQNIELTPHTLRRCFTTYNTLNGVPLPILQKSLGHVNIRTTSGYWKGSVDIREFSEWLEPKPSPEEPEEVPKVKVSDNPQLPKMPEIPLKLENPNSNNAKEPEIQSIAEVSRETELKLLKTIEKLKGELAEKDNQLKDKDNKISLLTNENRNLKAINQEKDRKLLSFAETLNKKDQKLEELQQKVKQLTTENNSLIQNYSNLKNTVKNQEKVKEKQGQEFVPKNNNFLLNGLSEIKERENNSLTTKEKETELLAQIQVWKKK